MNNPFKMLIITLLIPVVSWANPESKINYGEAAGQNFSQFLETSGVVETYQIGKTAVSEAAEVVGDHAKVGLDVATYAGNIAWNETSFLRHPLERIFLFNAQFSLAFADAVVEELGEPDEFDGKDAVIPLYYTSTGLMALVSSALMAGTHKTWGITDLFYIAGKKIHDSATKLSPREIISNKMDRIKGIMDKMQNKSDSKMSKIQVKRLLGLQEELTRISIERARLKSSGSKVSSKIKKVTGNLLKTTGMGVFLTGLGAGVMAVHSLYGLVESLTWNSETGELSAKRQDIEEYIAYYKKDPDNGFIDCLLDEINFFRLFDSLADNDDGKDYYDYHVCK